ncbi:MULTISPECIES: hypothetical protein [Paraburkholderia]|nr:MULTISPECIES: hypothetical protein [Paraburkholderia]MCX4171218.1 hypothetical protein [Paraburkholderia madseniana]
MKAAIRRQSGSDATANNNQKDFNGKKFQRREAKKNRQASWRFS